VLVVAVAIVHVGVPLLKEVIDRPRPGDGLVETTGESFPSGHATYAVIWTWLALTAATRLRGRIAHATALIVAGIVVTVAVGLTRVYLHVHYWSDVVGGWAFGVATFTACAAVAMLIGHFRQNQAG
jgi:undecaprenyl-diphosphatase